MKILHISTLDHGGAAKAGIRLHKGLIELGVDSSILFREQHMTSLENSYVYKSPYTPVAPSVGKRIQSLTKRLSKRFLGSTPHKPLTHQERIQNRSADLEIFSTPYSKYDLTSQRIYQEADIINLHWVTNFLDYTKFFPHTDKKIVWTLHDMNAFTGGCHYSGDCERFIQSCEVCPQLAGTGHETYSHELFLFKQNALANRPISVVSPSRWLYESAKQSTLFKSFHHHTIPYDVNHHQFKPLNKIHCREQLNLPPDKKIILFVADDMTKVRKGFSLLAQALEQLIDTDVVLCAVGSNATLQAGNNNIIPLGKITDEALMAAVYSAADVFVAPSLQDNLPNTLIESILCGTPAIAFPVGGVPDIINHGKNGILCDNLTVTSLQTSLNTFLNGEYSFDKAYIRQDAVDRFATPQQASRYLSLYQSILKEV